MKKNKLKPHTIRQNCYQTRTTNETAYIYTLMVDV